MRRISLVVLFTTACGASPRGGNEEPEAYVDDFEEPDWSDRVARDEPAAAVAPPALDSDASARDQPRSHRRGPRVDLDLRNTDLASVFRQLATLGGTNIVLSPSVKGTITLRLDRVAWNVALDSICRASGLEAVREQNVILIRPREP